jgi:hypothetical protein
MKFCKFLKSERFLWTCPSPRPSPLKKDLDANGGCIFGELNGRIENKETKF